MVNKFTLILLISCFASKQIAGGSVTPERDPASSTVSKREQKCIEYSESVFQEATVFPLSIPNGESAMRKIDTCHLNEMPRILIPEPIARSRQFPHFALLGYISEEPNNILWLCGGSLVSSRFVLAAAHCLKPRHFGPVMKVRLGDLNNETNQTEMFVEQLIPHPQFDSRQIYHDIGLVKLAERVNFSSFIRPICLPSSVTVISRLVIGTGWISQTISQNDDKKLQTFNLEPVTNDMCNTYVGEYTIADEYQRGIIDKQMCTKIDKWDNVCPDLLQTGHEDIYCMYTQLGVSSICASGIQVYTRVSEYADWIEAIIWAPGEDD